MRDSRLSVTCGRELAYTDIGAVDWPCVLFFHGAPSSRLRLAYLEERFLEAGVRVVSPDRPGYGASSPQPGRSLADWPTDITALADALGLDRFMVAGHSSGGAYALACAARLAQRVSACIILSGVTDMAWPDSWEGYPDTERELMRLPDEETAIAWCVQRFGVDGSGFIAASGFQLAEPDERLYADAETARLLASARAEAFRQGVAGYAQDIVVQGRPWPFPPSTIAAPVQIAHGDLDTVLPLAHSRHTSELIPGSRLSVMPGHGHFSILGELPTMAAALARSVA
jgi:pimeloyl-ACP methyl ester carboxylesterase